MTDGMYIKSEYKHGLNGTSRNTYEGVGYKQSFGKTSVEGFAAMTYGTCGTGFLFESKANYKWDENLPLSSEARIRTNGTGNFNTGLRLTPIKYTKDFENGFSVYGSPNFTLKRDHINRTFSTSEGAIVGGEYQICNGLSTYAEVDWNNPNAKNKSKKFTDNTTFNVGLKYYF